MGAQAVTAKHANADTNTEEGIRIIFFLIKKVDEITRNLGSGLALTHPCKIRFRD
jgi:hypothetical protein